MARARAEVLTVQNEGIHTVPTLKTSNEEQQKVFKKS